LLDCLTDDNGNREAFICLERIFS